MDSRPRDRSNREALGRFWRRTSFHDMVIQEVAAHNKRVVIRLEEFTLVVVGASSLRRCEIPTVWLYESIIETPDGYQLEVETDDGDLSVTGVDFRLLRNSDLSMLIPPIDA